jgi:hypothetical protein
MSETLLIIINTILDYLKVNHLGVVAIIISFVSVYYTYKHFELAHKDQKINEDEHIIKKMELRKPLTERIKKHLSNHFPGGDYAIGAIAYDLRTTKNEYFFENDKELNQYLKTFDRLNDLDIEIIMEKIKSK